jgi:membrane protease YdiL (CAAX protease family)
MRPDHFTPLPLDRSFKALAPAFAGPYLVFVVIASIPATWLAAEAGQLAKGLLTAGMLIYFRRSYRLGLIKPATLLAAVLCLPGALLVWIAPFYLLAIFGMVDLAAMAEPAPITGAYFWLRILNSAVLVALFEELFTRVYLLGWFYQAGLQRREKGAVDAVLDTLDQPPRNLGRLPLSAFSVILATLVFVGGHQPHEYLSAVLYFTLTTWLYHRTGSLWACILVHGLTNLAIALLARYGGMGFLW